MSARIISVNTSQKKGTAKQPVPSVAVTVTGIAGDAHAGSWHRQVSLLSEESIARFAQQAGRGFAPGEFAENLTTRGLDLSRCHIRDRLDIGEVALEVTQIGKACHGDGCAIYQAVGKCVMPKEGIFTRVIHGGEVKPGQAITHTPRPLNVQVITLSDRASRGEYEDRSGPAIRARLQTHFATGHWAAEVTASLLPDDPMLLRAAIQAAIAAPADIIFTTGGTGIGPRDITPDVIRPLFTREIPGIMEHIRVKYGASIPSALLSRSVAGLIGSTLVYALPGSEKAVQEYLDEILKTLEHSLRMLQGIDLH